MKKIFSIAAAALCSVCVFTACEDDNGSNPTIVTPTSFTAYEPEFSNSVVNLESTSSITIVYDYPIFTDKEAPLALNGTSGQSYAIAISSTGQFESAYNADNIDEEGNYQGTFDNIVLEKTFSSTRAQVSCEDINRALNQIAGNWTEDVAIAPQTVYARVTAMVTDASGRIVSSITSNVVSFKVQPYWVDLSKGGDAAYLWVPGNGNGWNHGDAPVLVSEANDGVYTGYAYMDGDFKFTYVDTWGEELNNGSFASADDNFDLGDQAGGNIGFKGDPGVYTLVVNTAEEGNFTLTATPAVWSVIGAFNSWGADDPEMTYNTKTHCLELTDAPVTDAGWKFRLNHDWGVNLGGNLDALTQDGDNITATGSTIQLFIERANDGYHAVVK